MKLFLMQERVTVNYTTTTGFSFMETTTEMPRHCDWYGMPCDWSWARRHAFAIAGFSIGLLIFPVCMWRCGFTRGGVASDSCASRGQR